MMHALILAVLAAFPQEQTEAAARSRAMDTRARCVTLLNDVEGINSVNYGGAGTDYRLMIVARDYTAKLAAQT